MTDTFQEIAIAIVRDGDQYLVGTRSEQQSLGGYSEFPGGKVRPGETPAEAAVRECAEETGLRVLTNEALAVVEYEHEANRLRLSFFLCEAIYPTSIPLSPYQWVAQQDLTVAMFPPANADVMRRLGFAEC